MPASSAGLADFDDAPSFSVAGGNQGIAHGLAAPLGGALRLASPVSAIADAGGAVRIGGPGGEVEAAAVIVAVPAPLVAAIGFDPPLPDAARDAIAALRYGQAAKLFVPLRSRRRRAPSCRCPSATGPGRRGAGAGVQPVVNAFAGSAPALDRLGVEAGPGAWLASLARLRPDLALDPRARCCRPGSATRGPAAPTHLAPAELARASERPTDARFAGEHLGGEFAALMEGAIRSGGAAAKALLGAA